MKTDAGRQMGRNNLFEWLVITGLLLSGIVAVLFVASYRRPAGRDIITRQQQAVLKSARALRPLWRDLIMRVWGAAPLVCPCCKGTMKVAGTMIRREEVEFFLRLHGMWEGIIALPPPPDPPYDIETMEPPIPGQIG